MNSISPILYEVNTRSWLAELSDRLGNKITLADVPDDEIDRWRNSGFTHVWLMGVWQVGPLAREIALTHWRADWHNELPSSEEEVHGSPFAIQEYAVDARLGQPLDLLLLRERMNRAGIRLIIDFVPNHLGLDSTEPRRYPARFVQSAQPVPGTFLCETKLGPRNLAHGRDPFFAPWNDTVQVDYRVAEAQESMSLTAQTISMFGEGLRCDMSMLILPEIFGDTWKNFPPAGSHQTNANFWRTAIPKIRMLQPHVEMIAETYWNREQELQDLGFDFTYNKRVTDFIVQRQDRELYEFLVSCTPSYLRHSVHFLENHDEARAATVLPLERHKAAAALILFLPGMALMHDGQLEGRKKFARIQIARRAEESKDPELSGFYSEILAQLARSAIRRGVGEILPQPEQLLVVQWQGADGVTDLGAVNLTKEVRTLHLPEGKWLSRYSTTNRFTPTAQQPALPPESAHIFHLES